LKIRVPIQEKTLLGETVILHDMIDLLLGEETPIMIPDIVLLEETLIDEEITIEMRLEDLPTEEDEIEGMIIDIGRDLRIIESMMKRMIG
jgi:hypothetical protein